VLREAKRKERKEECTWQMDQYSNVQFYLWQNTKTHANAIPDVSQETYSTMEEPELHASA